MSTVLAAVDDSIAAAPVITAASAVARLLGGTVEAVHVGEPGGSTARECAARAGVPFRTLPGEPAAQLLALAGSEVTAVVVGARDRPTGTTRIGHLTLELAERLTQPLLVVPPTCEPAERIERVLVALKGQPGRARELRHAVETVADEKVDLTVVHVDGEASLPAFSDDTAHETEEFAHEYLSRYWPLGPNARLALPIGLPADQVLGVADDVKPDLIVAGWPQGAGPQHGHVVRELLERSPYPLLLLAVA